MILSASRTGNKQLGDGEPSRLQDLLSWFLTLPLEALREAETSEPNNSTTLQSLMADSFKDIEILHTDFNRNHCKSV